MNNSVDGADHFAFGKNWRSFVRVVDEERIQQAQNGLEGLISRSELEGRTFHDIGCGAGLSSLAAARLGARSIRAIDIDPDSVVAANDLLGSKLENFDWTASVGSVFDTAPEQFDVVYSWGVLHHTGDMWRAIRCAASRVNPGGLLAIAIYGKTPFCPLWKREKALYSRSSRAVQAVLRGIYKSLWIAENTVLGRNPLRKIKEHGKHSRRGMEWGHDVHDWLGGYPYESATPDEVRGFVRSLGFVLVREHLPDRKRIGLLGSGCDEYLFRRPVG